MTRPILILGGPIPALAQRNKVAKLTPSSAANCSLLINMLASSVGEPVGTATAAPLVGFRDEVLLLRGVLLTAIGPTMAILEQRDSQSPTGARVIHALPTREPL